MIPYAYTREYRKTLTQQPTGINLLSNDGNRSGRLYKAHGGLFRLIRGVIMSSCDRRKCNHIDALYARNAIGEDESAHPDGAKEGGSAFKKQKIALLKPIQGYSWILP